MAPTRVHLLLDLGVLMQSPTESTLCDAWYGLPASTEQEYVEDVIDGGILWAWLPCLDDVRRDGVLNPFSSPQIASTSAMFTCRTVPSDIVSSGSLELLLLPLLDLSISSRMIGNRFDGTPSCTSVLEGARASQFTLISELRNLSTCGIFSLSSVCNKLEVLMERFANGLVRLATLSFRIIVDAELRTRCSLLDRDVIPGYGSVLRLQTSANSISRRARSARGGARIGIREFVVRSDCERLIDGGRFVDVVSLAALVFLRIT